MLIFDVIAFNVLDWFKTFNLTKVTEIIIEKIQELSVILIKRVLIDMLIRDGACSKFVKMHKK